MVETDRPAREPLETEVRAWLRALAVNWFGADEVEIPMPDDRPNGLPATRIGLSDPLAIARAAVLVARVTRHQISDAAVDARAAGRPWADVADALGFRDHGELFTGSQARAAFETIAGLSDPWWTAQIRWTCTDCGQRITDYGPGRGHPDTAEAGHVSWCPRQQAAVQAWQAHRHASDPQ